MKYTKVVLIYGHDEEGQMVASRFQMLTEDSDIHVDVFHLNTYISIQFLFV